MVGRCRKRKPGPGQCVCEPVGRIGDQHVRLKQGRIAGVSLQSGAAGLLGSVEPGVLQGLRDRKEVRRRHDRVTSRTLIRLPKLHLGECPRLSERLRCAAQAAPCYGIVPTNGRGGLPVAVRFAGG